MVKRIQVEGYEAAKKAIDENSKSNALFVLFSGSKDDKGHSWCPDCVSAVDLQLISIRRYAPRSTYAKHAEPIIEEGLKVAPIDGVFIYCSVGDRTYWSDPNNEFRKDERLKLTSVPTLIKWNTARRLDDEQCKSAALVTMLFED